VLVGTDVVQKFAFKYSVGPKVRNVNIGEPYNYSPMCVELYIHLYSPYNW